MRQLSRKSELAQARRRRSGPTNTSTLAIAPSCTGANTGVCTTAQSRQIKPADERRPEMSEYSAVAAVHIPWLAAQDEGIGMGWVSILDPRTIAAVLEVPPDWKIDADQNAGEKSQPRQDECSAEAATAVGGAGRGGRLGPAAAGPGGEQDVGVHPLAQPAEPGEPP